MEKEKPRLSGEEISALEERVEEFEAKIKCPFIYMDGQLLKECCTHGRIVVMTCDGYNLSCKTRRDYIKAQWDEKKGESKE